MPFRLPRRGPRLPPAFDDRAFLPLVLDFVMAATWPESRALVETHPEILTERADRALAGLMERARAQSNEGLFNALGLHRQLLGRCRDVGIDRAFGELLAGEQTTGEFPADLALALEQAVDEAERYRITRDPEALVRSAEQWAFVMAHPIVAGDPGLRALALGQYAADAHSRYRADGQPGALDAAIDAFLQAVALTADGDPDLVELLVKVANALSDRDSRTPNIHDLDMAIEVGGRAVARAGDTHPDLPKYLSNHASSLRDRFGRIGSVADLDAAFEVAGRAMDLTATDGTDFPGVATVYGGVLSDRYRLTGNRADLDAAIRTAGLVLARTPEDDPDVPTRLHNRASLLRIRFGLDALREDLDLAVEDCQRAASLTTDRSPERPTLLSSLAVCLMDRYLRDAGPDDLDRACEAAERAVELTVPTSSDAARFLSIFGNVRHSRYAQDGAMADLEESIEAHQRAIALTAAASPELPAFLSNLGVSLHARYLARGTMEDLRSSIEAFKGAAAITPRGGSELATVLNNLGSGLSDRYWRLGAREDLEAAIDAWRHAVALTGTSDTELPARLTNLSGGLRNRYQLSGDLADLEDGIAAVARAVALSPEGHLERPVHQMNLGGMLLIQYERNADPEDLARALHAFKDALERTSPESPDLPGRLTGLGLGMRALYARTQESADLDAAIEAAQRAVDLTADDAPELPRRLNNLGITLATRFARTRRRAIGDLDAAIEAHARAVHRASEDHPEMAGFLHNLGCNLRDRYSRARSPADREAATAAYRSACASGLRAAPDAALIASRAWLDWAIQRTAWAEAAEAGELGLQAADQLYRAQAFRSQRESRLGETQGIANRTAYAWARQGDGRRAASAIERGRAVLLADALRVRTELDRLEGEGQEGLADDYRRAAAELTALERSPVAGETEPGTLSHMQRRLRARDDLDAAIAAIQSLLGHEDFLRRITDEQLLEQAMLASTAAPLVYLIPAPPGGIAIVLQPGGSIAIIDLPGLSDGAVRRAVDDFVTAYRAFKKARTAEAWHSWLHALDNETEWLWTQAMSSLVATVRVAGFAEVTIVPTGPIGLLPLHAASFLDLSTASGHRFVLDDVLIRYAPNAQVLVEAMTTSGRIQPDSLLSVEEPLPVKAPRLAGAAHEIRAAAAGFSADKTAVLRHKAATRRSVLAGMQSRTVVHLACHGASDADDPLDSFLLMSGDEHLTLRDVLDHRLPRTRLVVLSACESAMVGAGLPDEVIALPTGLLQAGAAAVVGSLWSVDDLATMVLLTRFYRLWRQDGVEMSEALREAQRWTRDLTADERGRAFPGVDFSRSGSQGAHPYSHPFFWAAFQFTGA